MKICLFLGDATRCGGTERVSLMLANHLSMSGEFQICLLSLCESATDVFFPLNKEIRREVLFPGPSVSLKRNYIPAVRKLRRFLRDEKIDVLIDADVILSMLSIPAMTGLSCRRIEWEHFHYHENLGCVLRSLARRIIKFRHAPIVTLTRSDAAQYGAPPSRAQVVVIPNPIPDAPQDVRDESISLPEEPFLFSIGRFTRQKGFDLIPALAESFFKTHPGWKWVIAGDGPERAAVQADLRARKLDSRFLFPGWIRNPYPCYRKAAFLVMPSRFEGFGLNLLEALSQNCPVIAFDCPMGPAEIIHDGTDGFLIPPLDTEAMAEKINFLADSPDLRESMAQAAPAGIADFEPSRIVARWQTLLKQ